MTQNTQELLARAAAMMKQTDAEGDKPFAGSSYEKGLVATPSAGGGAPITTSGGSGLLGFKESLNQAINLAKQKRNEAGLNIMAGSAPAGTMMASDFNSILSNLNKASDKTIEDSQPTYKTEQIGSDLYQYQVDGNGRIIGDPVKILTGKKSDTESDKDELKAVKKKMAKVLENSDRDEDGYVTPEEFRNARQAWVADGYNGADFDDNFSGQVNPKKAGEYGVNFQTKVSSNSEDAWQDDLLKALGE